MMYRHPKTAGTLRAALAALADGEPQVRIQRVHREGAWSELTRTHVPMSRQDRLKSERRMVRKAIGR